MNFFHVTTATLLLLFITATIAPLSPALSPLAATAIVVQHVRVDVLQRAGRHCHRAR